MEELSSFCEREGFKVNNFEKLFEDIQQHQFKILFSPEKVSRKSCVVIKTPKATEGCQQREYTQGSAFKDFVSPKLLSSTLKSVGTSNLDLDMNLTPLTKQTDTTTRILFEQISPQSNCIKVSSEIKQKQQPLFQSKIPILRKSNLKDKGMISTMKLKLSKHSKWYKYLSQKQQLLTIPNKSSSKTSSGENKTIFCK